MKTGQLQNLGNQTDIGSYQGNIQQIALKLQPIIFSGTCLMAPFVRKDGAVKNRQGHCKTNRDNKDDEGKHRWNLRNAKTDQLGILQGKNQNKARNRRQQEGEIRPF